MIKENAHLHLFQWEGLPLCHPTPSWRITLDWREHKAVKNSRRRCCAVACAKKLQQKNFAFKNMYVKNRGVARASVGGGRGDIKIKTSSKNRLRVGELRLTLTPQKF